MKTPKTILYVYVMTSDTGVAPCVADGLLTLAVCKGGKKGGMRKSVPKSIAAKNDVYVMGVCGKGLAKIGKFENKENLEYRPIYIAKIDDAVPLTKYFGGDSKGRDDDWYTVKDGGIVPTKANNHSEEDREKDKGGEYVLTSRQFVYWGDKCGDEYGQAVWNDVTLCEEMESHPRGYTIVEGEDKFSEFVNSWAWFPKPSKSLVLGESSCTEYYADNDETEHSCGTCAPKRKKIIC